MGCNPQSHNIPRQIPTSIHNNLHPAYPMRSSNRSTRGRLNVGVQTKHNGLKDLEEEDSPVTTSLKASESPDMNQVSDHQENLASTVKGKRRSQRSLDVLTQRFVDLILSKDNYCLDLNEAANLLKVHKRRIYDVTNVLEGISYIQKIHKNVVKWVGSTGDPDLENQISRNQAQLKRLQTLESTLDKQIKAISQQIASEFVANQNIHQHCYINFSDMRSLAEAFKTQTKDQVFIISAPRGSLVEILDSGPNVEQKKVRITSETAPVRAWICDPNQSPRCLTNKHIPTYNP